MCFPGEAMFAFKSGAYIQVHCRLDFFMKANTMNPYQTALKEQSDLGQTKQMMCFRNANAP